MPLPLRRLRQLFLLAVLAGARAACASAAPEAVTVTELRYWDWTQTPKRDDYQIAALRLAMEKTEPRWGAFRIHRVALPLSTSRVRAEMIHGELINVHVAPWRPPLKDPRQAPYSLRVNVGLLGGLMGCRSLFIRAEEHARFKAITDEQALRQLTIGQGRGWFDGEVLRENQLQVEDSGDVSTLFRMLRGKRFDLVAMSMLEVDALGQQPELARHGIEVLPELMLFYPLPLIAYVSLATPQLATRLEQGLRLAQADGSLERLGQQHFQAELNRVRAKNPRVFVLKNAALPPELARDSPVCGR